MRRTESIKVGQEVVGNRVRARIVKNKVAAPFKVAEFDIMYNEGISRVGGILDMGVETGADRESAARSTPTKKIDWVRGVKKLSSI